VLATSRALTPVRRTNLEKIAQEEGFLLVQVHDQAAFADLLYRNPAWCRELLNLTGQPPALSAVPLASRPLMGEVLIGRGADIEWLAGQAGDALLAGQPGTGKTYILRELVKRGEGLFVVSADRGEIAAAIRAQKPTALFVDDAHHRRELLSQLQHLRTEIGATFRIVATCWPGEQTEVARALELAKSGQRELELLTRKEIAEVIRGCGIRGPRRLLKEILDQAKGRPGLAVTLCYLVMRDGTGDLASGTALFEDVRDTFQQLVGREAVEILAAFAVGGDVGMQMQTVAGAMGIRLIDLRHLVERLAAGGVLSETRGKTLAVEPDALRPALIGAVFFSGASSLPIDGLLAGAQVDAAALTLALARGRGARVPNALLRGLLQSSNLTAAWEAYASLGRDESIWVLETRPELLPDIAGLLLHTVPDHAVPRLFALAVGDARPLNSTPSHPLRQLHDWVKQAVPGRGDVVARRTALLAGLLRWHGAGHADASVCIRGITMAFETSFESLEPDPVSLMDVTIRFGGVLLEEVLEIRALWPKASPLLRSCGVAEWSALRQLMLDWAYPGLSSHDELAPELQEQMHGLAQQMMRDVLDVADGHPGVAGWIAANAARLGWNLQIKPDPIFEALYPQRDLDDLRNGSRRQIAAATALADAWAIEPAPAVAERLAIYADLAASIDHRWPDWTLVLAQRLADLAADPVFWAREMVAAGNSRAVIGPFLQRVLREQLDGWEALWDECFVVPRLRGMAVLSALVEPAAPEELVGRALKDVAGLKDGISTECLRKNVAEHRIQELLRHPDGELAESVASAVWHADPVGEVPSALKESWRRVVVEQMEEEHTLKDIFPTDPSIARDWLRHRVGTHNERIHHWGEDDDLFAQAINLVTRDERAHLIGLVTAETWPREIVSLLVGMDPDLYQLVLDRKELGFLHLEPLRGDPSEAWIPLARLAVAAGFSIEKVAGATKGVMWSWEGRESDLWKRWVEVFLPLASSTDPLTRKIGEAGLYDAQAALERAQSVEKSRAIYGPDGG
jgi:hypothetical protein